MRPLDGVIVIDKPSGPTSHDIVASTRRILGQGRIGHTGTLDPAATGVLPLVLGRATRLSRFLTAGRKRYVATIRLGVATNTYDAEGDATRPDTPPADLPDSEAIMRTLMEFRGSFLQHPPAFSAKRIDGMHAYQRARAAEDVQPAPVTVVVHHLDVRECIGDTLTLEIECSAGFYVRSLAHDLGRRLGVGAHLRALRRTHSGGFGLDDACRLEQLEADPESIMTTLVPVDALLPQLPVAVLTPEGAERVAHGQDVGRSHIVTVVAGRSREVFGHGMGAAGSEEAPSEGEGPAGGDDVRLLDAGGHLCGIAERGWRDGVLHPSVVLK